MIANRSVPPSSVVPVLAYADVTEAADWLCSAFGFKVRLRIADHRSCSVTAPSSRPTEVALIGPATL